MIARDIAQFRQRSRKIKIVYPHHFLCRLSSSRQYDRYYVIPNQQKLESLLKAYLDYGDPQFRAEYDRLIARHWSRSRAIHHPDILDLVVGYFCSREKEIFQHRRRKQMMKSMPEPIPCINCNRCRIPKNNSRNDRGNVFLVGNRRTSFFPTIRRISISFSCSFITASSVIIR